MAGFGCEFCNNVIANLTVWPNDCQTSLVAFPLDVSHLPGVVQTISRSNNRHQHSKDYWSGEHRGVLLQRSFNLILRIFFLFCMPFWEVLAGFHALSHATK